MVYICNGLIFIFGFIIEGYYTTQETSCTNEVDALRTFPYEVSVGRKVLSNRDRPSYPFKGRVLSNRDRPSIPFKEGSYTFLHHKKYLTNTMTYAMVNLVNS